MKESNVVIDVHDISVTYQSEPVLWNVTVQFKQGEITAIIGPNGAGKSTLLKTMLDFITPLRGTVHYRLHGQSPQPYKAVKKQIAYVPQNRTVDWDFPATVFDVVLMGRYGKGRFLKRLSSHDRDVALTTLEQVGMLAFKDRQINQLSGGQKQRVFLARALAEEADIYVLDEPLAGVDMTTEKIIMAILRDLARQHKTVLVVHHDLNTVSEYFDTVVFLNKQVITYGPLSTHFIQQSIDKTYRQDVTMPVIDQKDVM